MARKAKVGVSVFYTLLVGLALGSGIAVGRGPWLVGRTHQARAEGAAKKTRQLERTRENLLRQDAHLRSAAGKEEQARGYGWLLPGERSVSSARSVDGTVADGEATAKAESASPYDAPAAED